MKTGMDVFLRAMSLLGYTGIDGVVDAAQSAELVRRGLNIVNQVLADLWPMEKTMMRDITEKVASFRICPNIRHSGPNCRNMNSL